MFQFIFFDGTSYQVYEDDLDKARAKLAKAFIQLGLDQYVWKDKGKSSPPSGSVKVSDTIYLRKHTYTYNK